ncbi:L-lactate dehydrogenase [Occultella glacieicola]|uniref:L-lactate dehydrogenase n=1 Tax=Occultella glacieicola TaxID=2518684 RepID=A0ABY2E070_9MICO|nr:L-lactate dehydrogenase [Occultella glacieicola]TDE90799.1 L-lactate dehydrogenase [Occultella glacieicola]
MTLASADAATTTPAVSTLAIVGAGSVGSTLAYAALIRGVARRVVLYDLNGAKVGAEALDLAHGMAFMPMGAVEGSDDIGICAGADMVVVTAGAKQQPGQTRLELADRTITLMRTLVPQLVAVAPDALYLMVTNPVDVVTYAALKISGLPPRQMFGSGTVLDTSRLRYLLSERCRIAVRNVHAYIVGEHGDSEFALWSAANIGGVPLREFAAATGTLTDADLAEIADEVKNSAYRIIDGKGATNHAIGLAGVRIIQAALRAERAILPVSSLLDDYLGVSDVCLSVPSVVDRDGVGERLEFNLDSSELANLRASADEIRAAARQFGF